jgi:hypothetical protein
VQGWSRRGPRAIFGPRVFSEWPLEALWSRNILIITLKYLRKKTFLARQVFFSLESGPPRVFAFLI